MSNSVRKVSLPAAFLPDTGRYIHISEKIPSEARLLCPFCSVEVGARKGNVRQHHFYHRVETNCHPSKETLLHEGAKIFLFNSLVKGKPLNIIVPALSFLPSELNGVLESLNINGVCLSIQSWPGYKFEKHEMEKSIDKFRPDIRSYQPSQSCYFAWEIFVSHEIEDRKREYFASNSVQYVELRPVPLAPSGYIFFLESFNGFSLTEGRSEFYSLFFQRYKSELNSAFLETLTNAHQQKFLAEALVEARDKARAELAQACNPWRIAEIVECFAERLKLADKIRKKDALTLWSEEGHKAANPKEHAFEYIELGKYGNAQYVSIRVNQRHFLDSPIKLFAGLVQGLSENFELTALLNSARQVVGFDLVINSGPDKQQKERILLPNESIAEEGVYVTGILGRRGKNDRTFCIAHNDFGEFFVNNHLRLLLELLKLLKKLFKCSILLIKNLKNYDVVVGVRLHEVSSSKEINRQITEFCAGVLKELTK